MLHIETTKYALTLFFLCVRTNVCYQVVGAITVQYKNVASIEKALKVFKQVPMAYKSHSHNNQVIN